MPFQKEYTTEDGVVHAPLLFKTIMRITKFHFYFHTNYDQHIGCGETLDNPIHHLFKAYHKVECSGFVTFARDMQNHYYHQQGVMRDITYNMLITR